MSDPGITAARVASPAARWSGWLMYRSAKYRVVGSVVTTTSGRTRRISRTIFSRTSRVGSSSPSSYPRNSTWSTPTTLADASASASRNSANRSRVISGSLDPAAPLVTNA